jgi:hypothetical protein
MAGAGNLVVHLMAQTQHFEQGMRRGKSHTDQMRSSVGHLAGSMKMLAGAFGVSLGIGGLVMGLRKSMSLAQEQIKQEQKLEAVLRATGHAAGFSSAQLIENASALQRVTNYGDETIIGAQAVLATFKEIKGDVFKDATASILDMSAVMGTDLQAAAIQVGKALNDPIKGVSALSKVGVSFTSQQKDQIKAMQEAGDVAGAQKLILAELASEFGGAAEAMADPVQQLKNSMGDLAEAIGVQLLPFARMIAEDLTQPTNDAATAAKQSASEFGGLATGIFAAVDAAQFLAVAFKEAQLASTKLFLWNEETGKSWWGWLGEDVEAEAYIDNLKRTVKELEAGLKKTSGADWAGDMKKRYATIQGTIGGAANIPAMGAGATEAASGGLPAEWYEGLDFLTRMQDAESASLVSAEDVTAINEGLAYLETLDKWAKEKTKFDELGKSLAESLETPVEKFQKRLEELDQLVEFGSIDTETYQRALRQIENEIGGDAPESGPARFSGAMSKDSREAYSAVLAAQSGREDPSKKVAENTKDMKDQLKQIKDGIARQVALMEFIESLDIPPA